MSPSSRRLFIRVLPDSWVRSIRARRAHRRPVSPRPSPPSSKTPEFDETSPQSTVLTRVAAGERLDDAVVHQVRALLSTGDAALARTVGESLLRRPGTFELGSLLLAITAFDGGYRELAWKHFAQVNRDAWSRWAVREFVLAGTSVASATVIEQLRALVDETAADVTPEGWGDAAGHAFGIKEGELASALFARFDAAVDAADPSDLDPRVKQSRDWFRRWIDLKPDSRSAPALPEGHVSFGVMDYDHPGRLRASANIGDHVQSIASLGHLVRHTGATFHGDADLAGLLTRLASRVRDDLRIEGPPADVDVITVDRDASAYDAIPPKTWTLAFGWFMHPVFEVSYGLPPAPEPPASVRVLPLQQARPVDPRSGRPPQGVRTDRLSRLDHDRPAALDGRAGVLLRMPHHDDEHGVPAVGRAPRSARPCGSHRRSRRDRSHWCHAVRTQ